MVGRRIAILNRKNGADARFYKQLVDELAEARKRTAEARKKPAEAERFTKCLKSIEEQKSMWEKDDKAREKTRNRTLNGCFALFLINVLMLTDIVSFKGQS